MRVEELGAVTSGATCIEANSPKTHGMADYNTKLPWVNESSLLPLTSREF